MQSEKTPMVGDKELAGREIELPGAVCLHQSEWRRHIVLENDWRILVRPVEPHDDLLIQSLLAHASKGDLRLRFFDSIKEFSPQFIARLTQLDCKRAMAFLAIDEGSDEVLGVVRLHFDAVQGTGEYAILLRSDHKGRGLGWALMELIIEYAKSKRLRSIYGQILRENSVMLKMCKELGFHIKTDSQDAGLCHVSLTFENPSIGE